MSGMKIFKGIHIPGYGCPILVTAVDDSEKKKLVVAHYLFIERRRLFLPSETILTYDPDEIPPEIVNPVKWLDRELDVAKNALEEFFFQNEREIFNKVFLPKNEYEFADATDDVLLDFHLRDVFKEELTRMRETSLCGEFKKSLRKFDSFPKHYINVSKVEL